MQGKGIRAGKGPHSEAVKGVNWYGHIYSLNNGFECFFLMGERLIHLNYIEQSAVPINQDHCNLFCH